MSENVLDPEIGIRVRRLRKLNHMTQAELAEAVGVSVKHISGVERGVSNLSLENLIKACKTLDTGLDYLVFGKLVSHSATAAH